MMRRAPSFLTTIGIALVFTIVNSAKAQTLNSDKNDYPPGATAILTASGFQPGEQIKFQVLHADYQPGDTVGADHEPWYETADGDGHVITSWHVCEDDCVGELLTATADGQSSGLHAETTFTDAATSPTAQLLDYSQAFTSLPYSGIGSNVYPSGWQGWKLVSSGGSSPSFRTTDPAADESLIANGSASSSTAGVYNYNGKIGFLASSSSDPSIALGINTTSKSTVVVQFDIMTIRNPYDGSSNTRINQVDLQYRIGTSGAFTSVSGLANGIYQNNTATQTGSGVTTPQNPVSKSFTLPAACDNQAVVQIRWVQRDFSGGGSRPSFAIDNINIVTCSSPIDTDGDGVCDSSDPDDDNDGIVDANDSCPAGEIGWISNASTDHDADGCKDATEDSDDDNDGVSDANDSCPAGEIGWTSNSLTDHDGDGCKDATEDSDDDNDGAPDANDSCSAGEIGWTSNSSTDHDGDGCKDASEDTDDDNDGVPDANDSCPAGETGWISNLSTDHDGDGCKDFGEDADDDNDGSPDAEDCEPLNGNVHPGAVEICGNGIDDNCDGVPDESSAPVSATASVDAFCSDAGGTLQLTAVGGTAGTGALLTWYAGSCDGGIAIGTGNPLTIDKPTATTTYYARYEGACNNTTCTTVLVTVNSVSAAPTGVGVSANNVCAGTSVTLSVMGGSLGTGASWKWYSGDCASQTSIGTGSSVTVNPSVTTTYYVRAEGTCNTSVCTSATVSVLSPTLITDHKINLVSTKNIEVVYGCAAPVLSVVATGEGSTTYKWFKNTTNSNSEGTQVTALSVNSSYTIPALTPAGTYYYYVEVTAGCGTVKSDVFKVVIDPQEADAQNEGSLYYTGPANAWTPTATSNSATLTLSAFIKNKGTDNCGDITTARISFEVKNSSGAWIPISSAQNLPVDYIDPNNPANGGTAAAIVQLNITNNTSTQIFDLRVVVSGNYTANPACGVSQITVSRLVPGGSIAGGVILCGNTSMGQLRPSTLVPSLLGFGVEYSIKQGKVQSPKGKVNMYVPSLYDLNGENTFPHVNWYKVSSNAIASLAITSPTATFTSKASVSKYDPVTGELIPIEGNCTMVLDLNDQLTSGNSNVQDLVGIIVYKNAGGVWYSNNWVTSKTVPRNICGGDLTVSGTTSASFIRYAPGAADRSEQGAPAPAFSVKAYPNPSDHCVTLNIRSNDLTDKVVIKVCDIVGRQVYVTSGAANKDYRFGDSFAAGVYIVEVRQGDKQSTIKLIKQ